MINTNNFFNMLTAHGTEFFTGVPDSLLKNFCAYLSDNTTQNNHIIAVNEGCAIALAAGFHLATGKIPLVYMQNSGIGNAVNPLLSLADSDVYSIPMILLISWRGEPGVKDEPQHLKQGKVTCAMFEAMGIPHLILSGNEEEAAGQLEECYSKIKKYNSPFALIVRKDIFAPYSLSDKNVDDAEKLPMSREDALDTIVRLSSSNDIFVSTTGMASRELYELREKYGMSHEQDFLTVGSMGHASSIALAIALQKPEISVTCIDGDGAALMHLGGMAAIGALKQSNLRHIVLNNGAHDSVGGQPTIARKIDLCGIARGAGYIRFFSVKTQEELHHVLGEKNGPLFIEVMIDKGNRKDLGRPGTSPQDNKEAFMRFLSRTKKRGKDE